MNLSISFAPLVPSYVLWAALAAAAVVVVLLFLARSRGALLRALALALIIAALANPSFTREDRDPLPSVAVLVVDKSASQNFGDRGDADRSGARRARPNACSAFLGSNCVRSKPASRMGRATARACSPRSARRSPMCRRSKSPARSC